MFMGKVEKPQRATARFALVGQPCQKPYRVRVLGYRETQVHQFLRDYAGSSGPRYEEICCATGIGTLGEVSRIIIRLERFGELAAAGYLRTWKGGRTPSLQRANKDSVPPVVE